MNILVFDTETISVDKPFCYNIGYVIYDTDEHKILVKRDFVVEQVWYNQPLFETAYYYDKRQIYVDGMRSRKTKLMKYGFIQRKMISDIKQYHVDGAYAFNSDFDERVFKFNSDYYHCSNALELIPVYDIRGHAVSTIATDGYFDFCDKNSDIKGADGKSKKFITDADGYKTTAESFYCFMRDDAEYNEEHTALADSLIELEILLKACTDGADLTQHYTVPRSLPRNTPKVMYIKRGKEVIATFDYVSKTERKCADGVAISIRG